jgi:hypothetical protein
VSVLKIDTDYAREKALEPEILTRHSKLQKRWRLSSYEDLIARKGIEKARANIKLRFYQDALESFKPRTRRDIRALYALCDLIPACPFAIFYFLTCTHDFGENVESLDWLPGYTSQISYYRSKQVQVYEFKISAENFERWAQSNQMQAHPLSEQEILSRDSADLPVDKKQQAKARPTDPDDSRSIEQFEAWQSAISIKISNGLIELMVVVLVVGILALLAVPGIMIGAHRATANDIRVSTNAIEYYTPPKAHTPQE